MQAREPVVVAPPAMATVEDVESRLDPSPVEDEIQAMQWVHDAMELIDRDARRRVLEWARARYDSDLVPVEGFINLLRLQYEQIAAHRATGGGEENDKALWAILDHTKWAKK